MPRDTHDSAHLADAADNEWACCLEVVKLLQALAPSLDSGELKDTLEITKLVVSDYANKKYGPTWDVLDPAHLLGPDGTPICLQEGIEGEANSVYSPHPLSDMCEGCIRIQLLEVALEYPEILKGHDPL